MIDRVDNLRCCGCGVCVDSCPTKAIVTERDALGFPIVRIDIYKCVDCGICNKVCPLESDADKSAGPLASYAFRTDDEDVVSVSRSGGAFTALSDVMLCRGGMVVGVAMMSPDTALMVIAGDDGMRDRMRGSKYIQADAVGVYSSVGDALKLGREVMFSGTPCQVDALKRYLKQKRISSEGLVTVDIVCHGVASPRSWHDCLKWLQRKWGDEIVRVNFRDKNAFGWDMHRESVMLKNGEKRVLPFTWYDDVWLRPSCNQCPYASMGRCSDITIGDFWGRNEAVAKINADNRGVSMLMVNTPKGAELCAKISDRGVAIAVSADSIVQPNLMRATPKSPMRDKIVAAYLQKGYESALKRMGVIGWRREKNRIFAKLRRMMRI